ncbi:HNH endonuclease domain-containing protein [Sansalvadorimonas verongulae]|uniref:HNH endonuclease domain-containing protein n=1 Tax=Sansalvadorimonas verongulae TaxID=2172824 RepID=UPI0038B4450F
MSQQNQPRGCGKTGSTLAHKKYEVDHCFPYANWSNNDLWNLMPATKTANSKKSNKLPAGGVIAGIQGPNFGMVGTGLPVPRL